MTKVQEKFAIKHNVESLTAEERTQYLRDASEFFGLDPDLNALDLIYMSDEYLGPKRLVVYARKGTTDILRGIKGITVCSLTPIDVPGTASFVAIGTDKTGRQEIAVGSSPIAGFTGERLASAIMTAQTRALRRLTLQFVGGGLLDESEVNSQTASATPPAASAATLAGSPVVVPPIAAPAAASGKDITKAEAEYHVETVPATLPMHCGTTLKVVPSTPPTPVAPSQTETKPVVPPKPTDAPPRCLDCNQPLQDHTFIAGQGRVCKVAKQPAAPTPELAVTPAPASTPAVSEAATEPARVRKTRTPRKPKNTVTLGDPAAPATAPEPVVPKVDPPTLCFDCGEILKDHEYVDGKGYICKPKNSEAPKPAPTGEGGAVGTGARMDSSLADTDPFRNPQSFSVPAPTASLTADQFKDFRQRLRPYSNDILPKQGGMLPSEGIGGPSAKLSLFALKYVGATSVEKLSISQWEDLFDFLDTYNKENGAKALVAYINEAIGAK